MRKEEVHIDPMNKTFAKVMEVFTLIGLIVMVIFGLLYLFNLSSYVDTQSAIAHWGHSASKFWEETKGVRISGYNWFLTNLNRMDCLSMLGIVILALTPFLSIVFAIPRSKGAYRGLLFILTLEFIFAILRPLIMAK